mmetsp:Transcript_96369/g.185790  ORF Transcript_96369/g.185790 Transcript_96369/m.185790 type:complete len:91 (+) Transcript_96369:44-316(+)
MQHTMPTLPSSNNVVDKTLQRMRRHSREGTSTLASIILHLTTAQLLRSAEMGLDPPEIERFIHAQSACFGFCVSLVASLLSEAVHYFSAC